MREFAHRQILNSKKAETGIPVSVNLKNSKTRISVLENSKKAKLQKADMRNPISANIKNNNIMILKIPEKDITLFINTIENCLTAFNHI